MDKKTLITTLKEVKISIILGFGVSIIITLGIHYFLSDLRTSAKNPHVLETILVASRYLNSAVIGGTTTALALILNLMSIGYSKEKNMSKRFYRQIYSISVLSTIALILAIIALLFTSFPVVESEELPRNIIPTVYWSFIVLETIIVSILLSNIFVLVQTVWQMTHTVRNS